MAHFHFATVTTLSADRTDLQIYIVAKFGYIANLSCKITVQIWLCDFIGMYL